MDKQPAVVPGRFACALGAHLCELLDAFWPREDFAWGEDQSLGLLSNYQESLVGRAVCSLPPVTGDVGLSRVQTTVLSGGVWVEALGQVQLASGLCSC